MRTWVGAAALLLALGPPGAHAWNAPSWMHALSTVSLPAHDEKTNAVLLYSETALTVQANGKVKRMERRAWRILRPDGAVFGKLLFIEDGQTRVTDLHAWCIPVSGKDYDVSRRDGVEAGLQDVKNGMLASDIRGLLLQVPDPAPGSIIGYEATVEGIPYILSEEWNFQQTIPVSEARFSLQLPKGWSYTTTWLNHVEAAPATIGENQWQWTLTDLAALRVESHMPSFRGLAGRMILALNQPNGRSSSFQSWREMGAWYDGLTTGRRSPSPELKQTVTELTASAPDLLERMRALATFVQEDIRYVAIELGIGGYQPHSATEVFTHRYGDCKDKATLLSAMLQEIGVKSYYVIINTDRGAVTRGTPPNPYFNHVILAVALPADLTDPSLEATVLDPSVGRLLFFDPTNDLTPFGGLAGSLQGNFGMLVTPNGGELIELPHLPVSSNGIARSASLTLDEQGTLRGDVHEVRLGLRAAEQRFALRTAKADTDQIKPVEALLAGSLSSFQVTKASVLNLPTRDKPFEWRYSIDVDHYARTAGDLILVRPRVIGTKVLGFLETKEPREYAIEFPESERDTDVFEIAFPAGYEVDTVPAQVDLDDGFASYHSKTEAVGHTLRYSRSYEIAQLSVPVDKAAELKALYRVIEADERNVVVLKRAAP